MIQISKPQITEKDIQDLTAVLKSGMIVQGPKVKELEEKFAKYCETKYAVAVNSGTAALHAALYALGIEEGDEVITTPFTFVATANSILMQNAKVKFVDIDEESFNLCPKALEKAITKETKAIVVVSLYGRPYDQEINRIAKEHGIKVIDDACQAIGSKLGEKKSGSFADISCFSLYATKNIMCAEGGMITTDNAEWAELCKRFRHHGQSEQTRYQYFDLGYNYRLTDIHAAIGLNQLAKVEEFTEKRIENAKYYNQELNEIKGIITPNIPTGTRHCFHQYTLRITKDFPLDRDAFRAYLSENNIGSGIYYPQPLHLHPHKRLKMDHKEGDFPVSEKVAKEALSLPVHPSLKQSELKQIIKVIKQVS